MSLRSIVIRALLSGVLWSSATAQPGRQIRVTIKLQSGNQATGLLRDYDDHQLILQQGQQVHAIPWDDIQTPSAYQTKKQILATIRGSADNLTAEDHFQLGYFLAIRNSHTAAVAEFRLAEQRDPSYGPRIKQAWRDIRREKERRIKASKKPIYSGQQTDLQPLTADRNDKRYLEFTADQHRHAIQLYKSFGQEVRDRIAPELVLLETRNFLIWTDWPEHTRNLIPDWAEQMYNQMCNQFGFPNEQPIWLGKCPIFCFDSQARFTRFAQTFDDYDGGDTALGYTKTTDNGYVHVVLRRLGREPADIDKFATTMVHEATHAFMHCYRSPRNLPPWLSEGIADYVAERVLGERCNTGETAAAVARLYAHTDQPIDELFEFQNSPPGQYYPVAHSIVQYLMDYDHEAFVALIDDLKDGLSTAQALARQYKGMTTSTLEHDWRSWVRRRWPPPGG